MPLLQRKAPSVYQAIVLASALVLAASSGCKKTAGRNGGRAAVRPRRDLGGLRSRGRRLRDSIAHGFRMHDFSIVVQKGFEGAADFDKYFNSFKLK
jgi:hypothetical protein